MDKELSKEAFLAPSPLEFDKFVPWACSQLQLPVAVIISRIQQQEYASANTSERTKPKAIKSKGKVASQAALSSELDQDFINETGDQIIFLQTAYDHFDNLVRIKFNKNIIIPRLLLKIIALTVKYHTHLTSIVINSGMNEYTLYEICKFLPLSYITDICLDGAVMKNTNYQILLEQENFIHHLSLSRCDIDDDIAKIIADTLVYPLPASKTLSILNLSSNKITDVGAASIAYALRTNRHLSYLNLGNNMITDEGVSSLLNTLLSFPLNIPELIASRARHMDFIRDRTERISALVKELKSLETDKRTTKSRQTKPSPKKKLEKEKSLTTFQDVSNTEVLEQKAAAMVEASLGHFNDPFNSKNTFVHNGFTYCQGNNSLCYLNLSYNNWSYITLNNIVKVLLHQKKMFRKPRGLINMSIEGNCIPGYCKELQLIDILLDDCLSSIQKVASVAKKKTLVRAK